MKKTLAPLQSIIIGYTGYLIAFILLGYVLYRFLVAPFILMLQESVLDQEFVLEMGGNLISNLLSYGVLAVIIKIISDAVLQGKKWGLLACLVISVFVLVASFNEGNYFLLLASILLLGCAASALNYKLYNRQQ